jgi:hypothetical protein
VSKTLLSLGVHPPFLPSDTALQISLKDLLSSRFLEVLEFKSAAMHFTDEEAENVKTWVVKRLEDM